MKLVGAVVEVNKLVGGAGVTSNRDLPVEEETTERAPVPKRPP